VRLLAIALTHESPADHPPWVMTRRCIAGILEERIPSDPGGRTQRDAARKTMLRVEIRIKGQIDEHWTEWFEGLTVAHVEENETILGGPVVDQAALYGLLAKLRDLGLPLISVSSTEAGEENGT
jgi:hypothetical protein